MARSKTPQPTFEDIAAEAQTQAELTLAYELEIADKLKERRLKHPDLFPNAWTPSLSKSSNNTGIDHFLTLVNVTLGVVCGNNVAELSLIGSRSNALNLVCLIIASVFGLLLTFWFRSLDVCWVFTYPANLEAVLRVLYLRRRANRCGCPSQSLRY